MDKNKNKPHYVNNEDFSNAIVEYVRTANEQVAAGQTKPVVTTYIAECFLKIAEGLSHKANFIGYTYREEMVMDAVENCLKAIDNYNLETATRTGNPNAFGYFTQIAWYAFLRRMEKEKKQHDIKLKFFSEYGVEELLAEDNDDAIHQTQSLIDDIRVRIDLIKTNDRMIKEYAKEQRRRRRKRTDSDLTDFFMDEEFP
jgi:hypothetical protein